MNIISRDGDQIVTVAEAKANSRVTTTAEDANFAIWVDVAHEYVESNTNHVIQQSTVEDVFVGDEIELKTPVRGLVSVKTYDNYQVETTTTDYTYKKLHSYGLKITLDTEPENYTVVRYVAGFGEFTATTETAINEGTITAKAQLKQAILLLVNHYYENRGVVSDFNKYPVPMAVNDLLDQVVKYQ